MRGYVFRLLMMTCLLVLPVGYSYACGTKHSCVKTETKHASNKKTCCDRPNHHQKHGGKKEMCEHNGSSSGCDCAHSASVFALNTPQTGLLQNPVFTISQANVWFYKDSTPKPVYLSLWMPPNISC